MIKVLNIGRNRVHGGEARHGQTAAGQPTHSEARRDRQTALIARNRPFLF